MSQDLKIRKILYLLGLSFLLNLDLWGEDKSSAQMNTVLRQIPIKVSQGVAVDEKYFYGISNTRISKHDKLTNEIVASWQAKGDKFKYFKHLNSGTVIDGKLYCAHSRFAVDPNDCTVEIWDVQGKGLVYERGRSALWTQLLSAQITPASCAASAPFLTRSVKEQRQEQRKELPCTKLPHIDVAHPRGRPCRQSYLQGA